MNNELYFAGGCLWGVQEYCRHLPGVIATDAGRANGSSNSTSSPYDGYAECVRIEFDATQQSVAGLMNYLFEIIDPFSLNQQGGDVGLKYRTGVYSLHAEDLHEVRRFISAQEGAERIVVEVLPLHNFVRSDVEHQDRLHRCPNDYCHIDEALLYKYRKV